MRGDRDGRVESVEQHGTRVVVAFSWADRHNERHHWAQLLQLRGGLIVDMQDNASPKRAEVLARLRARLQPRSTARRVD